MCEWVDATVSVYIQLRGKDIYACCSVRMVDLEALEIKALFPEDLYVCAGLREVGKVLSALIPRPQSEGVP